jgi:aminopeptidase YwaD
MFDFAKILTLFAAFYIVSEVFSQDISYAKDILNEISSDKYLGRGYVKKGDKKAAKYINQQFKSIGLKPMNGNSYYQNFSFPVNTFPKTIVVTVNGRLLKPGVDFIINPDCPSFIFNGTIPFYSSNKLNNEFLFDTEGFRQKMVVLDTFNPKYQENAALNQKKFMMNQSNGLLIQLTNEKLTWGSSFQQSKKCIITINKSAVNDFETFELKINIKSKFIPHYTSQNVIGFIKGTSDKDSFIVFSAHYDHLGVLGKDAIFNGANDNASGIAMMLNLAKHYSVNQPKFNMVFIAFSGEELGLIGSRYYVENPFFPLSKIKFLINIDLMGNGADGVMAVNGSVFTKEFNQLKAINEKHQLLPNVKSRGKAANSDHYWFSESGVRCFFFYLMGAYPFYHDVFDRPEVVPFTNYENAFLLFKYFIDDL